jgi:hypothetical protein
MVKKIDRIDENRPYCWSALVGAAYRKVGLFRCTVRRVFVVHCLIPILDSWSDLDQERMQMKRFIHFCPEPRRAPTAPGRQSINYRRLSPNSTTVVYVSQFVSFDSRLFTTNKDGLLFKRRQCLRPQNRYSWEREFCALLVDWCSNTKTSCNANSIYRSVSAWAHYCWCLGQYCLLGVAGLQSADPLCHKPDHVRQIRWGW